MSIVYAIYSEVTGTFSNGTTDFKHLTNLLSRACFPSTHSIYYFESELAYQVERGNPVLMVLEVPDNYRNDGSVWYKPVECADARNTLTAERAVSATYADTDTDADLDILDKRGNVIGYTTYDGRTDFFAAFENYDEDLETSFIVQPVNLESGDFSTKSEATRINGCVDCFEALTKVFGKSNYVLEHNFLSSSVPYQMFTQGRSSWVVFQDLHKVQHKAIAHKQIVCHN